MNIMNTIFRNYNGNRTYNILQNLITKKKSTEKLSTFQTFTSKSLSLCLQVLNISLLLFKELDSPLYIIQCFSFRHNIHFRFTGLKEGAWARIFQVMSKSSPLSLRFQIWPANLEEVLLSECAISQRCSLYLVLKGLNVSPVQDSTF